MLYSKPKSILGLDVGSKTVKAIELTLSKERFIITAYGQADIPSEGAVADTIRGLIRDYGFKTKRTVSAVSGRSVIVRYISMLKMSDEDLQNAIKFEADKYIPFEVDEVVLDCQKLEEEEGEESNEMKVLLVAVKRTLIDEHVSIIQSAGLLPKIIDVDSFALGNAFELTSILNPKMETDKVVALINVGSNKTNINIMKGTTSLFTREVYLGGNDFTDAISRKFNIEMEEAERLKREPAEKLEEIKETVAPVIDDLGNEINLSFDYFENQFDRDVEIVYLSGGGSKFPDLEETFQNQFNIEALKWDPFEGLEIAPGRVDERILRDNASQLAIAIGLASRLRRG